jgi:hypothetical protein
VEILSGEVDVISPVPRIYLERKTFKTTLKCIKVEMVEVLEILPVSKIVPLVLKIDNPNFVIGNRDIFTSALFED